MKKIFMFAVTCVLAVSAYAEYTMTIADFQIKAGKSVEVPVNVTSDHQFMNYNFEMVLPAGLAITSVRMGDIGVDQTPAFGNPDTNIFRVSSFSPGLNYMTSNSGVLLYMTIEEAGTNSVGSVLTGGTMRGIKIGDEQDNSYTSSFTVTVIEDKLDLYDDATDLPAASTATENVVLHRKLTANIWNSFCVPFDMDATQIEEAFGAGAQVAELTSWTTDTPNDEANSISLGFTSTSTITANEPVIVYPTVSATEISITGVNGITPETVSSEATYTVGSGRTAKNYKIAFKGSYVPTVLGGSGDDYFNHLYLYNNKFYFADQNTTLKGYRAYIDMGDNSVSGTWDVKMFIDDDLTAIKNIDADNTIGKVYTVDGKYIGEDVDLNRMQKGIYIVNGKKVINK